MHADGYISNLGPKATMNTRAQVSDCRGQVGRHCVQLFNKAALNRRPENAQNK